MSNYKASIYNYLFNSINSVVVIVNGIVMVPIYFHYMSVATYGAWLATGNVVAMLGLLEGGFSFVITQKMSAAIAHNDTNRFCKLAGSNILSAVIISLAILLLGLSLSPFITSWINISEDIKNEIHTAFIVSLVATCISIFTNLYCAFPQVWQETKQVGLYNTLANIFAIASLVLFLIVGCGVVSIALSYIVRSTLNFLLTSIWIIHRWRDMHIPKPIYSISDTIILLKDCIYPFLSKLSGTVVCNSQSFVIAHFMNSGLAAVFDLTSKIIVVACGFVSMMNGSFFALFSLTLAEGNSEKTNRVLKTTSMFFTILLVTSAVYSINFTEPIMNYWLGIDKYGGTSLLVLVVVANVATQMRSYFNSILCTGGLINISSKYDLAWMFSYVLLLFMIIGRLQIFAIPVATFISCMAFIWLYLRLMKKKLHLNVRIISKMILKILIVALPFVVGHLFIAPSYNNIFLYCCYFVIFTLVYISVLYFINKDFFTLILVKIHIRKKYVKA